MEYAALQLLWGQRRILAGDYLAGARYGDLSARRDDPAFSAAFAAAHEALSRVGQDALRGVETLVLRDRAPATERALSHVMNGLDELNRHFRHPPALFRPEP